MENQNEAPKVTAAEVADWEENFKKTVSPLVKFDKQDNGYSMKFYNGESGIDAYWSGTIMLKADNYIKWSFSVLNGVFMDAKFNIEESNKGIPANLYEFYKSWEAEVASTITEPEDKGDQAPPPIAQPGGTLAGPESNNIPDSTIATPGTGQLSEGSLITRTGVPSVSRKNLKRESVIMDSMERMRRLAGL